MGVSDVYALAYVLALFILPGVILLTGGWVMDRHTLTARGVNVVAGGVLSALAVLGVVLILIPAPFGA
jgi:hypothetical protein